MSIDLLLLAIIAVVTYCVASEGPWGAGITFISVILAGLLAMNFFESATSFFPSGAEWSVRSDFMALLGLFAAGVAGLRALGDYLMPTRLEVNPLLYEIGRWGFGLLTGYVTMAIVLTSLHTAPLPREFLGFRAERNNFFGARDGVGGPDRQWLAFTQYVSENIYTTGNVFDRSQFSRFEGRPAEQWSSFPIRYATRRQQFAAGGGGMVNNAGPSNGPPPAVRPVAPGSTGF